MDGTIALMLIEAFLILLALSIYKAFRFISPSLNGNQPVAVDDSSTQRVSHSHIVVSPPPIKYDVFLSFRGEDTRHTFANYLYNGLHNACVHTFMDHKLRKGEQISRVLLRTIEESKISVIIFSENYASSKWCMDELVHLLECKEKFGRAVIPIFYKVDPSNICKQNGCFGKGFNVLRQRFKDNQEKLQKWRNALIQSTSLSGWDSNSIRPEFKLVEEIVKDTLSKLNYKSSSHLERLVGIACHVENIEKLLIEARIVGIWGMGGAGKTTLAKAIFQELKVQFDAFSFIENVKGQLANISLDKLQQNCLKELLKDEDISIYDIKSTFVKSRLRRKKILLILDDVDNSVIVEDLTQVCDWFGKGSRIVITSRNEQVLKNASAFSTYHVPRLCFDDAIHLFSLKAFKQHEPSKGYVKLSKSVVGYCDGNPLALVVLGCFLFGRGKEVWESALEKLNEAPPKDIVDVLKLSYDGLDDKQKNVFLDLIFFIMEGGEFTLSIIRQLYGSSVQIEISVLREKSLISFSDTGYIVMHDLVKKMGREIAIQQLFYSPKAPILLWRHDDMYGFSTCDKGIEAIRCISLDSSKIKRITWTAKELRFFHWDEYPRPYVPIHLCAENLIALEMPHSSIRQLWNGYQHFPYLKEIQLSESKHLIALPDLSYTPKIEEIFVRGCMNLAQIHSSIFPGKHVNLCIDDCGPMQINIGGSMKRTSSGLVIVYNYLDLHKLSFNKVTMKLFVSGNIISGVRFKHVVMPLAEIAELRLGAQSLASLLPFVRKLDSLESSIEFGDDFNQHYTYDRDAYHYFLGCEFRLHMKVRRDRREMISDNQREMVNDDQVATALMEVEEEEVLMEHCGSNTTDIFTRIPNSITRWSLLRKLTVKKSDIIGNAGSNVAQVSILKSLSLSHYDYCKRIKPHLDVKLSFHDIPPSALHDYYVGIRYNLEMKPPQHAIRSFGSLWFGCYVNYYPYLDSNYDLIVEYEDWSMF
ncbi:hypothetical protein K1719_001940 [Acacia pycnantha]|nr:hypothetical protein K1719_001940 [Acacia pycnantha]